MISRIPKQYKEPLYAIGEYAQKLGLKAWVVGGAVRDFYLKKNTLDIDLAFDGNQESVAGFCVKRWGGGKRKFSQFGTFRVNLENGLKIDMVRARKEAYPYPGALPVVAFSKEMKDDLFRRDFTSNAWCFSILPQTFGQPYDPFGAKKDIDAGIIRILHDKSFLDDPTRMYRAVRFAGRFGWKLAPKTERLLREAVKEEYPLLLTRERFCQEFLKVLKEKRVKEIFSLMEKYDMLKFAWPGLHWNDAMLRVSSPEARMGVMICLVGASGENFLKTLRIPKETAQEILGAWKIAQERMCPLGGLSVFQREILQAVLPGLAPVALEPCFIRGGELREIGLAGRKISGALDRVRKAQWNGEIKTKEEAVAFLKK